MDRREQNVMIFDDTMDFISKNEKLMTAVKSSIKNQRMFGEKELLPMPLGPLRFCKTAVSGKRSLEAAREYCLSGKKVCVLNFASATNPGGGVTRGSTAQEESLCRISTLYPCLNVDSLKNDFYLFHREMKDSLYNDDCIYTPGVTVFKSDTSVPVMLSEEEWYSVDVLTMAAPNLNNKEISEEELYNLQYKRIERIFHIAILGGAEVLILGAFGCGAFKNDPKVVAKAFFAVQQEYGIYFDNIEYAVFCSEKEENYEAFASVFNIID